MQELQGLGGFRRSLGGHTMCDRVRIPQATPKWMMHRAVKLKTNGIGDPGNVECLQGKPQAVTE